MIVFRKAEIHMHITALIREISYDDVELSECRIIGELAKDVESHFMELVRESYDKMSDKLKALLPKEFLPFMLEHEKYVKVLNENDFGSKELDDACKAYDKYIDGVLGKL